MVRVGGKYGGSAMERKAVAGDWETEARVMRAEEVAGVVVGKSVGEGVAAAQSKAAQSSWARPQRRSSARVRRREGRSQRMASEGGGLRRKHNIKLKHNIITHLQKKLLFSCSAVGVALVQVVAFFF